MLGDLHRIALVQLQLDLRIARSEIEQHRRQNVTRLQVRRRDRERALVLAPELGADAFQVAELAQRAPRGRDDGLARGRERGEPLALAHEHAHAELVLELPDLLADPRLRGVQCLGCVGYVEPVVDDRAEVAKLLQVHGGLNALKGP